MSSLEQGTLEAISNLFHITEQRTEYKIIGFVAETYGNVHHVIYGDGDISTTCNVPLS